jgi:hypothetical protein
MFVDTEHVIRFMNKKAIAHYNILNGVKNAENLLNCSLFECHNELSKQKIISNFEKMREGKEEIFIGKFRNHGTYQRSVKDLNSKFLGYYVRYEDLKT